MRSVPPLLRATVFAAAVCQQAALPATAGVRSLVDYSPRPSLSSLGEFDQVTLAPDHCAFNGSSLNPAPILFAGVRPSSRWTLTIRDTADARFTDLPADASDALTFALPGSAEATLVPTATTTAPR